jgi:hypothetical protein
MSEVSLALYKDELTKSFQVAIEDSTGGYRLLGPKFSGHSKLLKRVVLTRRDALSIQNYLEGVLDD